MKENSLFLYTLIDIYPMTYTKLILITVGAALTALSSCSTVNGIGQDLGKAGRAISGASR